MRKPRLTESMVDKLRSVAAAADVRADEGPPEAKALKEGCQWIFDLCNWYDEKKAKELRERAERKVKL